VLFSSRLGLGLGLGLDLVSGWLVVMHTYSYYFRFSLPHCSYKVADDEVERIAERDEHVDEECRNFARICADEVEIERVLDDEDDEQHGERKFDHEKHRHDGQQHQSGSATCDDEVRPVARLVPGPLFAKWWSQVVIVHTATRKLIHDSCRTYDVS